MSDIQIGTGLSTGGGKKKEYRKLKDGDSIYRILPALGDLAKSNTWSVFWKVHYGYKNTQGYSRVFESPLVETRTKPRMIESPDAALEFIDSIKAEIAKQKSMGPNSKPVVDKLEEIAGGRKSRFNLDNNHYMNAVDLEGNIVILKIRHRAKQALDAAIKKLEATGVVPLSPNDGRYFVFSRSGMGLDTAFSVSVYQEEVEINGKKYKEDKIHVMDAALIGRLRAEAGELNRLFKSPTSAEVAEIVKTTNPQTGISPAVDKYLDSRQGENSDEGSDNTDCSTPAPAALVNPALAGILAQATPTPQPAVVIQPQAAAPQPAVLQAPVDTTPVQAAVMPPVQEPIQMATASVTQAAARPVAAQSIADTSDADFLASLGVKTG